MCMKSELGLTKDDWQLPALLALIGELVKLIQDDWSPPYPDAVNKALSMLATWGQVSA